ncbi:lysophospholipid acyltransferase family protein [soil metagenome]
MPVAERRRRATPRIIRLAAALARLVLGSIARVSIEGRHNLPRSGPLIVVANHLSNADPPLVVGWLTPALDTPMHILAKAALFVGPLGAILRSQGVTPVRAGGSDIGAYRAAKAVLDRGEVLCIFPEGTRSRDGRLGQPKPGVALLAIRAGVPIVPVGISGSDRFLVPGRALPRLGARIVLRVGRPFTITPDPALSRRGAVGQASEEIMRRLAALVDERHRGDYQPLDEAASALASMGTAE